MDSLIRLCCALFLGASLACAEMITAGSADLSCSDYYGLHFGVAGTGASINGSSAGPFLACNPAVPGKPFEAVLNGIPSFASATWGDMYSDCTMGVDSLCGVNFSAWFYGNAPSLAGLQPGDTTTIRLPFASKVGFGGPADNCDFSDPSCFMLSFSLSGRGWATLNLIAEVAGPGWYPTSVHLDFVAVPEPGTLLLIGVGLAGLYGTRQRFT
jgi:hypothetical protein